jgi:predicted dehydrogenase
MVCHDTYLFTRARGRQVAEPVGIGIIGAGFMASTHATSVGVCENTEPVAVAALDVEAAQALASAHGMESEPTVEALLGRDDVHAVVIATPTDTHSPLAVQAMDAGKHVFVEKPMARTLEQAQAMLDAQQRNDRVLVVGHVIRYLDEFRALGDAIERGDIGVPAVAQLGRRCQTPDWSSEGWLLDDERSGGVLLDMMVHDIDLVRWWFGEPTRGYAKRLMPEQQGLDYALATLTVPDGPICHLHASWCEPEGFSHGSEVAGSRGLLHWDMSWTDDLRHASHEGVSADVSALPPPDPHPDDPWVRQLNDFVAAIRGERPAPGDGQWGYRSLEIALALMESAASGKAIDLNVGVAA